MNVVVLDSFTSNVNLNFDFKKILSDVGGATRYFKLENMNVQLCRGCGACGDVTPGKCILDDDMEEIFKAIAKSTHIVLLTPLVFGGYSSILKKALDRFMVLGLPLYEVRDGRLYHQSRYEKKHYIGIALTDVYREDRAENFKKLVFQNADNLDYWRSSAVFTYNESEGELTRAIFDMLEEVGNYG